MKALKRAEWKTWVKEKRGSFGTGFEWRVTRFDKIVAQGEGFSYEECERRADAALAEAVVAPAKRAGKKYMLSQLLQQYVDPRPNLVLYVFQCLAQPEDTRSKEECIKGAAQGERDIAERTQEAWRTDPPTHGRALPAEVVAERLWDAAVAAGYVGTKAAAKGEALFAYWWHEQDCEPGVWTKNGSSWEVRPLKHLEAVYAEMQKPKTVPAKKGSRVARA